MNSSRVQSPRPIGPKPSSAGTPAANGEREPGRHQALDGPLNPVAARFIARERVDLNQSAQAGNDFNPVVCEERFDLFLHSNTIVKR